MGNPNRQPGDPLPGSLIKQLRQLKGWTQDQLAARLGLRGGKATVSAWETGASSCEGPAAELILSFLGGTGDAVASQVVEEVEALWRRAGNWASPWRQIVVVPEIAIELPRAVFVGLFPDAAIEPALYKHGFPFTDVNGTVYGIGPTAWTGSVPTEPARPPKWLWHMTRRLQFVYREQIWEDDVLAQRHGNTDVGSLFELAVPTVMFWRRLVAHCKLDPDVAFRLRIDLDSMKGRGIVSQVGDDYYVVDAPRRTSANDRVSGAVSCTTADVSAAPLKVACDLIGETVMSLRPDLATDAALTARLRRWYRTKKEFKEAAFLQDFANQLEEARPRPATAKPGVGRTPR